MNRCTLWNEIQINPGAPADYVALAQFHYRAERVGVITRILTARCALPGAMPSGVGAPTGHALAGVLVEALPQLNCAARNLALPNRYTGGDRALLAARLNAEMRTIARVIIHPTFRGIGLSVALVREALRTAETPYVEALAAMGRVHPFFRAAGMQEFDRPPDAAAARLLAALAHAGLRPIDLADGARIPETPLLLREFQRFTRRHDANLPALLNLARPRLLSQPLYYLWHNQQ